MSSPSSRQPAPRLRKSVRGACAAVGLAVLLVVLPWGLAVTIGSPVQGLRDLIAGDVSDAAVIAVLASVTWLAWVQFALAVLVETVSILAHTPIRRGIPGVLPSQQHLARALVTAVFVLIPALSPMANAATAHAVTATASVTSPLRPSSTGSMNASRNASAGPRASTLAGQVESLHTHGDFAVTPTTMQARVRTYTVTTDGPATYWDLAREYLDDGQRWSEIWDLNQGRRQSDGTLMSSPGFLLAGWQILIPAGADADSGSAPGAVPDNLSEPASQPVRADLAVPAQTLDGVQEPLTVGLGLGVGAGLVAAACLTALLRDRRQQFRHRHPGRAIALIPADLAEMERGLLAQGTLFLPDAEWLDEALRDLALQVTAAGARLPQVLAVRMGTQILELVLAQPREAMPPPDPPAPWQRDRLTGRWQLRRADHIRDDSERTRRRRHQFAPPYPTLVSIGYSSEGDYWLLDLEQAGALALVGDRGRCLDLARFVAADLAHHPWSELLQVSMVGFGAEVVGLNPDRLAYGRDAGAAVAGLRKQLQVNEHVLADFTLGDALHGRQTDIAADQWFPQLLLIDEETTTGDPPAQQGLRGLVSSLRAQTGRSAVAVLVVASPTASSLAGALEVVVDVGGGLHIPELGLKVHAQQLPAHEAGQLARLLAVTATTQDQPMPVARGQAPWDLLSDAAGAPRSDMITARTEPRDDTLTTSVQGRPDANIRGAGHIRLVPAPTTSDPGADDASTSPQVGATDRPAAEPGRESVAGLHLVGGHARHAAHPGGQGGPEVGDASSLLAQPVASILAVSATTARDVQVLAPSIPATTRLQIDDADPDLDHDLAAWHSADTKRPRLSLLGSVEVRAMGALPTDRPRLVWHTEVVAYLASNPRGVNADQLGTDLWPQDVNITSKPKLRQTMHVVRKWLGTDPTTGQPYLPLLPTAAQGGVGLYRINGLLSDAELFRRLRLRGVAHGSDGIGDLEAALLLVTGPPFGQRRSSGYAWLTGLDHEYTAMIVDVAHLVATYRLANHQPDQAAAAAQISLQVASHDDVALLDLVAACDAQGNDSEARVWIQKILSNHGAEVEEDLPPRTAEILYRRQWTDRAR